MDSLKSDYQLKWKSRINISSNDPDSKLGTYKNINPDLHPPISKITFETERILLTRYRTGNHKLFIERGRFTYPKTP